MMSPEDVIMKLGELQPDEIARLMKDSGILAVREAGYSCAVTAYLYKETNAQEIYTGVYELKYFPFSDDVSGMVEVPLPATVRTFVDQFDLGVYPELDAMSPMNQE